MSHCLGVGGRDLSAAVGGRSTRAALALLDDDPATELIVLVSKPPDPAVAAEITAYAGSLAHAGAARAARAGRGRPRPDRRGPAGRRGGRRHVGRAVVVGRPAARRRRAARCAGCSPAARSATRRCSSRRPSSATIRSNIPLRPEWARRRGPAGRRAPDARLRRRRAHPGPGPPDDRPALPDRPDRGRGRRPDAAAVLLLDVVLGHGAHPDPAAELAPALAAAVATAPRRRPGAGGRRVAVRAPQDDPQDPRRQAEALHGAGASVFLSNAAAARHAVALVDGRCPHEPAGRASPRVVAVGAQLFADALAAQAVPVDPVDWRPPLGEPGIEADLARVLADPRRGPRPTPPAVERMLTAGRRAGRRPAGRRRRSAWRRASSCTPGRRSTGTARPARCAAR